VPDILESEEYTFYQMIDELNEFALPGTKVLDAARGSYRLEALFAMIAQYPTGAFAWVRPSRQRGRSGN
jgi:hypothetical protein